MGDGFSYFSTNVSVELFAKILFEISHHFLSFVVVCGGFQVRLSVPVPLYVVATPKRSSDSRRENLGNSYERGGIPPAGTFRTNETGDQCDANRRPMQRALLLMLQPPML